MFYMLLDIYFTSNIINYFIKMSVKFISKGPIKISIDSGNGLAWNIWRAITYGPVHGIYVHFSITI